LWGLSTVSLLESKPRHTENMVRKNEQDKEGGRNDLTVGDRKNSPQITNRVTRGAHGVLHRNDRGVLIGGNVETW